MGRQMSRAIENQRFHTLDSLLMERRQLIGGHCSQSLGMGEFRLCHFSPHFPPQNLWLFLIPTQLLESSRRFLKDKGRTCVEGDTRVLSRHPWMPSQGFPPETDCNSCSAHSCTRSNTQAQCKATLKAHRVHTLLVQNTLFMTEQ